MPKIPGRPSILWFLFFAALFALQVLPRFWTDSPTGDEVEDLVNGFFFWGGDVISNPHHPPLAKSLQALPLRLMDLVRHGPAPTTSYEQRAFNFLFVWNRAHLEGMMTAARSVTLALGLGLGFLMFLAARDRGLPFLVLVLGLWSLEPNLLAFSGQVLADVPLAFFYFLAVMAFQSTLGRSGVKEALLTGTAAGMALGTKFSAAVLVPLFLLWEFLHWKGSAGRKGFGPVLRKWAWGVGAALGFLCLLYLPGTLRLPDHGFPLRYFLEGFRAMASFPGHPTYFMGELGDRNHWDYYPVAFLLKSPLPFLVLLLTALWGAWKGWVRFPLGDWLPGLAFFTAVAPFQNIGIREVLAAYPFFILVAASGGAWLWGQAKERIWVRALVPALLGLQAISVLGSFPYHIGYFNELVPKDRMIYWLGDSNLDIGQDSRRLALKAREAGWKKVKLAFFGVTDPGIYGLRWEPWDDGDLKGPRPGTVYAINDAYLQLGPAFLTRAKALDSSWILTAVPSGQVGDTWTYFEVRSAGPKHDPAH